MPRYHNNQLNVVGLDSELQDTPYRPTKTPKTQKRKRTAKPMMNSADHKNDAMAEDGGASHADPNVGPPFFGVPNFYTSPPPTTFAPHDAQDYTFGSFFDYDHIDHSFIGSDMWNQAQAADYGLESNAVGTDVVITDAHIDAANEVDSDTEETLYENGNSSTHQPEEQGSGDNVEVEAESGLRHPTVSSTPNRDSDYEESDYDERRPSKTPKLNKDGIPRKPRQPRLKLLKWDDNDWKNVALGLVWACGENGIQIPFQQASQVVSESCTAGALQQALLKLRGKQIAEGYQIPSLRMAWTRKNKNGSSSTSSANIKSQDTGTTKNMPPKKRPTRFVGNQSLIVTLRRAYHDADRLHLVYPHKVSTAGSRSKKAHLARPQPSAFNAAMISSPMYQAPNTFAGNRTPDCSPIESGHQIMEHIQKGLAARYSPSTPPVTPNKPNHRRGRHPSLSSSSPVVILPSFDVPKPARSHPRFCPEPQTPTIPEHHQFPFDSEPFDIEPQPEVAKDLTQTLNMMYYTNAMPPSTCNPNGLPHYSNNNDSGTGGPGFGGGMGGGYSGGLGTSVPFTTENMWA